MVTAGCPGGPGRPPVARAWPSRHLASAAAAGCGLLQCNSGQDGRTGTFFWMRLARLGSQSTLPSGVQCCVIWLHVHAAKRFAPCSRGQGVQADASIGTVGISECYRMILRVWIHACFELGVAVAAHSIQIVSFEVLEWSSLCLKLSRPHALLVSGGPN